MTTALLIVVLILVLLAAEKAMAAESPYIFEWAVSEDQVNQWVRAGAADAGIASEKVKAIVYIESRGNPRAVNPTDPSYGLMQIMLSTAQFYGGRGVTAEILINEPFTNARLGVRFLADLDRKYASRYQFAEWAQAYNVGETKFNQGIRNPNYGAIVSQRDGQRVFLNPGQLAEAFKGTV